jgi:hypothetical protein
VERPSGGLGSLGLGVRQSEACDRFLPFSIVEVQDSAMVTLSEDGLERTEPAACQVGDWVKAPNLPKWKIGMQEFIPDGQPESKDPWYFGPVFNGPNLFGWQRLE